MLIQVFIIQFQVVKEERIKKKRKKKKKSPIHVLPLQKKHQPHEASLKVIIRAKQKNKKNKKKIIKDYSKM